ncbi:hypothetical protein [Nocardia sp. NPDC059239]|uniref:hypothetical protein n=1 Tax=unclassified Nocardia TaxID=2637762 RepID=UPI00369EEFF1
MNADKPADPWYSMLIDARDYQIVHYRGDESGPSGYGVTLRGIQVLRLRKVGGTAEHERTVLDVFAAALDLTRLADRL